MGKTVSETLLSTLTTVFPFNINIYILKKYFTLCTEYIMKSLERAVSFKHNEKQMFPQKLLILPLFYLTWIP